MKNLRYFFFAFTLMFGFGSQAQTNELPLFLKKFEAFTRGFTLTSDIQSNRPMPVPMPNPVETIKPYEEDAVTGLLYYRHLGKVYDPKTGYYIDFIPNAKYRIDFNSGKVYIGEVEIEVKKQTEKSK